MPGDATESLLETLWQRRRGHFELESGHHGELWLDLESLCRKPRAVRPLVLELAERVSRHDAEIVCGALVEGAFLALLVADELGLPFVYCVRGKPADSDSLFPYAYRLPEPLRDVAGKRIAIVNDVINAGSAVRGTLADLRECGAEVAVLATLLTLGDAPSELARQAGVPLEALAAEPNTIWSPEECPLCARGVPLMS